MDSEYITLIFRRVLKKKKHKSLHEEERKMKKEDLNFKTLVV